MISFISLPFFALCVSPGDSRSHNALHCILGNQHYFCQLFQLQPWIICGVSSGHCSFFQHYLHCHVTCYSGSWPPASACFHQVFALCSLTDRHLCSLHNTANHKLLFASTSLKKKTFKGGSWLKVSICDVSKSLHLHMRDWSWTDGLNRETKC